MYAYSTRGEYDGDNNPVSFDIDCYPKANYQTECERNKCECDKELARTLYSLIDTPTGSTLKQEFMTDELGNGYDFVNKCTNPPPAPLPPGIVKPSSYIVRMNSQKCCGPYPNRNPYQDWKQECCSNSYVASLGQC